MITFINKLQYPVVLNFENDRVEIAEYEKYILDTDKKSIVFSVSNEESKKFSILAFLLLMFVGVITFFFELTDNHYVHFEKYVSIPIEVELPNIQKDVTVEIDSNPNHLESFYIYADTEKEAHPIIIEADIKKQYREYKRETFAVLFLPIIIIAIVSCAFIINQAYIFAIITLAVAIGTWLYFHNQNIKSINRILNK